MSSYESKICKYRSPVELDSVQKGFRQLLQGSLLGRILGTGANFILTRTLGVGGFGALSLYLQLIQTCEILCRCGLDYALSYCTTPDPTLKNQTSRRLAWVALQLGIVLSISTILVVGTYISLPVFGFPWPKGDSSSALRLLLLACIFSECLGSLPWELMLAQRKIRKTTLRQVFFGPLKLLGAGIGSISLGLDGAIIGWLIGSGVQLAWLGYETPVKQLREAIPFRLWKANAFKLIRKGFPFYSSNLLNQLVFFPLLLSVAASAGVSDISFLRIGQICAQLFGLTSGALAPILFITLRGDNNASAQEESLNRSLASIWIFNLAVFAAFSLVDRQLIGLSFGSNYTAGIPATRILICCTVLDSLGQIVQQSLLAKGLSKRLAIIQNIACLLSAGLGWIIVPIYGLGGYLISRGLYSLFPTIGIFFAAKQVYPGLKIDPSLAVGTMMMIAASIISLTAPGIEVAGIIQLSLVLFTIGICVHKICKQPLAKGLW